MLQDAAPLQPQQPQPQQPQPKQAQLLQPQLKQAQLLQTQPASHPQSSPQLEPISLAGRQPRKTWTLPVEPKDLIYLYDGSLQGFFCCVYESIYLRELPASIQAEHYAQPSLLRIKEIPTDGGKSRKVQTSLRMQISEEVLDLIETVFLSCLKQKELHTLRFILLAYREGARVLQMLGHPEVTPLLNAEKHLMKEAHLLKGFVRFSDYDGVLAANITPKNFILPFLANHFCARYAEEDFILYDKTHKAGLLYQDRRRSIVRLDETPFPQADAKEERYRSMWKRFYDTIAIEARINPRCRMTNMPKRYWENMTEMADQL